MRPVKRNSSFIYSMLNIIDLSLVRSFCEEGQLLSPYYLNLCVVLSVRLDKSLEDAIVAFELGIEHVGFLKD